MVVGDGGGFFEHLNAGFCCIIVAIGMSCNPDHCKCLQVEQGTTDLS
jgi:hypothetical protein